jgi:hypothetical protein
MWKAKSIESLRQGSTLLYTKAPDDAAAFKGWLRQISQSTAEAAKEGGGLLGLGGVQVSDAEKQRLPKFRAPYEVDAASGTALRACRVFADPAVRKTFRDRPNALCDPQLVAREQKFELVD